ncbi:MAG TPA: hypothetical protein ENL03_01440, partial [Phycisphaerae bacterium]|nr:hypothetical protein [Phycisphaerae bacterium]
MRAKDLSGLLRDGDRIAVSNITGREASGVSVISQAYAGNIVGGWALGKGGMQIKCPRGSDIPVFADCETMMKSLPAEKHPNKVIIYSPPAAVYGDFKETITHGGGTVETIFVITEHVSVEVSAKIAQLAREANIDVLGCNTLGIVNVHDHVRVGAVGGDEPAESFAPGSASIFSNSGNMVNTIASSLLSAGIGTSFGVSTGKDMLILTPLADLLALAEADEKTRIVVLYIEPGGLYEHKAIELARAGGFTKPIVVYVGGRNLDGMNISLGHAGAVVEGEGSTAAAKAKAFDDYFGAKPFDVERRYRSTNDLSACLQRGIRVRSLHDIPAAVQLVYRVLNLPRDHRIETKNALNPWFVNLQDLGKSLPQRLVLMPGKIPQPWG